MQVGLNGNNEFITTKFSEPDHELHEKAAIKIQNSVRKYLHNKKYCNKKIPELKPWEPAPIPGSEMEKHPFNCFIFQPKKAPKSEISLEKIEKCLQGLLLFNDRKGVLRLANILFGTPHLARNGMLFNSKELIKLREVDFYTEKPEILGDLFIKALKTFREKYYPPSTQDTMKDRFVKRMALSLYENAPEEMISITHGGGYIHLQEFIAGKTLGYPLEAFNEIGIQVSTNDPKLSFAHTYARRAAKTRFDTPAILTGRIARKYLRSAPNYGYEAGLLQENARNIQDLKIITLEEPFWFIENPEGI